MKVELVYDLDCPNVARARTRLLEGFAQAGLPPRWREWDRHAPDCPAHARRFGSPAILVDGRDADGVASSGVADCCRLYADGAPSREAVARALRAAANSPRGGWCTVLPALPGIGFAFLPKLACPFCWPAYTAILSSLGLGFLTDTTYLFPLIFIFLVLALGSLAWRARERRGYLPFALGLAATVVLVFGKFHFESTPALYAGIALLVAASIWNAWPRRSAPTKPDCPACPPPI